MIRGNQYHNRNHSFSRIITIHLFGSYFQTPRPSFSANSPRFFAHCKIQSTRMIGPRTRGPFSESLDSPASRNRDRFSTHGRYTERFTVVECGARWYAIEKEEKLVREARALRDSYSTFLHTHLVVSSLVHDGALPPPLSTPLGSFSSFCASVRPSRSAYVLVGPRERELYVIPRRGPESV